jgi:putative tryptophan/tyrosine transport system substrate-binding protein
MRRREFTAGLVGAAAGWPLAVHAQQPEMPVIGFLSIGTESGGHRIVEAFRRGLSEQGYVEGRNVTVEYHWLEGQYVRAAAMMADLVRRRVAVIATPATNAATLAAKAATATIPIVFGVSDDPVTAGNR